MEGRNWKIVLLNLSTLAYMASDKMKLCRGEVSLTTSLKIGLTNLNRIWPWINSLTTQWHLQIILYKVAFIIELLKKSKVFKFYLLDILNLLKSIFVYIRAFYSWIYENKWNDMQKNKLTIYEQYFKKLFTS